MMAFVCLDDKIDLKLFADNALIGGMGGDRFEVNMMNNGAILKEIRAWEKDEVIHGVEVVLSDGSIHRFGKDSGREKEFIFEKDEIVTRIIVQSGFYSKPGDRDSRLRSIFIFTNQGRVWNISPQTKKKKVMPYEYSVGSGVCCGIFGYSDASTVYRIGFAMLLPIKQAVMTKLNFKEKNHNTVPESITRQTFSNPLEDVATQIMKITKTVTTTRAWRGSRTIGSVLGAKVAAKFPGVINVEGNLQFSLSGTLRHDKVSSESQEKTFEWQIPCPPGKKICVTATVYTDIVDAEYEAEMEVHLKNGKIFTYKDKGTYTAVDSRDGDATVEVLGNC